MNVCPSESLRMVGVVKMCGTDVWQPLTLDPSVDMNSQGQLGHLEASWYADEDNNRIHYSEGEQNGGCIGRK